jgi:hypothetical protein
VVCISWSALFLTVVSIYLYLESKKTRMQSARSRGKFGFLRDFIFVWVLVGLLGLYIVSIDRSSSIVFASGNLVVEALLIVYTVKNRPPRGPRIDKWEAS